MVEQLIAWASAHPFVAAVPVLAALWFAFVQRNGRGAASADVGMDSGIGSGGDGGDCGGD